MVRIWMIDDDGDGGGGGGDGGGGGVYKVSLTVECSWRWI